MMTLSKGYRKPCHSKQWKKFSGFVINEQLVMYNMFNFMRKNANEHLAQIFMGTLALLLNKSFG